MSEAGTNRQEGEARSRPPWLRWALIALAVVAAFGLGLLLRQVRSDGDSGASSSESVAAFVQANLAARPQEAALGALDAARSDPSPEAELAMLDVAVDGQNVERTVDAGAPVTAALALEHDLVTAGNDGSVKVWSRSDGALVGEADSAVPLTALAETEPGSPYLAALDRHGAVELVDVTDPARPRVANLGAGLSGGEAPLAVSYSKKSTEIVAIGAGGEVLRLDATTGGVLSRSSLREMRGSLPWKGGAALDLAAARFIPEAYEDEEGLLVGTGDGAVADVDLIRGQGKTVLPAGVAPGRILSLDRYPYGETELAVGTSGGLVTLEEETGSEPQVVPGAAVTGVAISEEELWRGGKEGVAVGESDPSGSPVLGFELSDDGIAAVLAHGRVSVLAPAGVGISMAETEYTPVASFGPDGRLYVAEGYDANHIEELRALRPQPRPPGGGYQEDDILQTYVPGRDWWPEAGESEALYEEEPGLYVNDVASDAELLVAGGQDPSGDAAVMVWDAKTGKPLQHLSLGTGGVTTELPSIVSEVMLLPGKHEIAAYSATQELVAIWSTDTWELEDSVPIGAAGGLSLSPDEETIVAVGIGEDDEGYVEPDERTDLTFVDVDSGQVTDKVPARGVTELAFSPDGSTLALGDVNGFVRFRSADGRSPAGPLVGVKGGIEALAWQPDGALLAVALSQGGVVLVDPESGQFSEPLPHESFSPTVGLSWSEDGNMLAALNPLSEEESEGSAPDPGPAAIWTIGAAALERRMCELAACQPEAASASSQLGDASQLSSVDVVFQAEGGLLAADTEGDTARIGWLEEYPSPTPAYSWSASGFAWSSPGRIGVLLKGEEKPRSWPCACSGVAWSGGEVLSLDMNGKSLVRIDPERGSVKTTPVDGVPSYVPTLLGAVDGTPIAAAYEEEPSRATPSALFELQPDGTARKLIGDAHGSLYLQWPSSSPHTLAFVTYLSGGACYSFANVGVVSRGSDGRLGVDFPASPLDEDEPNSVRSLQVAADGSVSAAIARIGCDKDGVPEDEEPPADRYVLEGSRWRATGEEGYDVQAIGGGPDLIEESEGFGKPGTLFVVSDGEREELASDVERAVARP